MREEAELQRRIASKIGRITVKVHLARRWASLAITRTENLSLWRSSHFAHRRANQLRDFRSSCPSERCCAGQSDLRRKTHFACRLKPFARAGPPRAKISIYENKK